MHLTGRLLLFLLFKSIVFTASGADTLLLDSPRGHLLTRLTFSSGKVGMELYHQKQWMLRLECAGLETINGGLLSFRQLAGTLRRSVNRRVHAPYGPSANVDETFNEITLLLPVDGREDTCMLTVRIYDYGLAFRYTYAVAGLIDGICNERNDFRFHGGSIATWAWADYQTLEKTYQQTPLSGARHVALPFTLEQPGGVCLAVAEAAVVNYTTATFLRDTSDTTLFHWNLVPAADGCAVTVFGNRRSLNTPWRVLLAGNNAAELAASPLIWLLNEPPDASVDWSWVKPINYCGIWWEMHLGLSTWKFDGGRHGATTLNAKRYIDFAAVRGIKGVLIEGWNTGWERWGENNAFDFVTPYPDFDLAEVSRYARSKGVELIGHHETGGDWMHYEEMLDSAFALYASLGIHYVKTGYAGPMHPSGESHHGQLKVEHLQRVAEKAAKYKIMIDAHEPVMPSGLSRTWPNLMTFEAVRGMEWNAWSDGNSPSHHCFLPFTRALAGPLDYTSGIVNLLLDYRKDERVKWNGPDQGTSKVHGTLSHQLALSVVFYSPMQMMSDLPENYADHPFTNVLAQIPVTWDETRILDGKIGKYIVVARRSGTTWYIAGITNEMARKLKVQLPAAGNTRSAVLYRDATETHFESNPAAFCTDTLSRGDVDCQIDLAPGGGFLIVIQVD